MHEIPLDPTELAVIFLAIGAGAFIKGLTGTGFPLVAVPIMAIFFGRRARCNCPSNPEFSVQPLARLALPG